MTEINDEYFSKWLKNREGLYSYKIGGYQTRKDGIDFKRNSDGKEVFISYGEIRRVIDYAYTIVLGFKDPNGRGWWVAPQEMVDRVRYNEIYRGMHELFNEKFKDDTK